MAVLASRSCVRSLGAQDITQGSPRRDLTSCLDPPPRPPPPGAPAAGRPSTLSADFIKDLLAVTGGGHGKSFPDIRDYALIRVLTEGLRRTEVTQMRMSDLPLDLVSQRQARVVTLKGARAEEEGRVALIAPATAQVVVAYLRARRYHRLAESPFVWLGLRNGGPLDGTGLYRMLRRRADHGGPAGGPGWSGTSRRTSFVMPAGQTSWTRRVT